MKFLYILLLVSCTTFAGSGELPTANYVDIERYLGKWYAVTSLPQFFTRDCTAQTAEYGIINSQTISVVNTCIKKKGSTDIKGQAVVKNAATNAELIVTFDSFFTRLFRVKGDYTIIRLDPQYRYSLVGSKNRKSLWLLSRTPVVPEEVYESYVAEAQRLGFPVAKLVRSQF
jgi:apolipoprotein D and lipocalin family protein